MATTSPAASPPSTASAKPTSEPPVEKSKPSTRVLTADELAPLRKSMASGTKVIKEQSFLVEFEKIGECSFVSALAPNEREFVFFIFKNGKVYKGLLTPEKLKNWVPGTVNAVAFKDVDGDGLEDIVVVAEYMAGVGQAGKKTPAAIVFMRVGVTFKLDVARSEKASKAGNDVARAAQLAR